ncbi:MAG: putative glycosyltransferase EpsE [Bacteroidota bacterium]
MKPTISVALCTYNGEKFLKAQLESILQQSLPVDEIIICDDGSTDKTLDIVHQVQASTATPIQLYQNSENLGSSRNFEQCVKHCSGDYIFLSDQDDLWKNHKVERIMQLFHQHKDWMAVFSNAQIINQQGEYLGNTAFDEIEFTEALQENWKAGQAFHILLRGYVVTGATLAIRKEIVPQVFPTPNLIKELIHDGWIALFLSIHQQIGFTNECLIDYRTHASQQVGFGKKGKKITLFDRFKRDRTEKLNRILPSVKNSAALYDYFITLPTLPKHIIELLESRKNHFVFRYQLPENRLMRILPILGHVQSGSYAKHEVGKWWRTVLGDLFE